MATKLELKGMYVLQKDFKSKIAPLEAVTDRIMEEMRTTLDDDKLSKMIERLKKRAKKDERFGHDIFETE